MKKNTITDSLALRKYLIDNGANMIDSNMKNIEKTIRENQEEFMNMVINFVNKKMEDKPKRTPKTICSFNVLGKEYNSKIFTENYKHFLNDVYVINENNKCSTVTY